MATATGTIDTRYLANNLADLDLQLGQLTSAQRRLADACQDTINEGDPNAIMVSAETMAAAIGADYPLLCARVYGCASTTRVVEGLSNDEYGDAEDERVLSGIRPLVDSGAWDAAWEQGQGESIVDLFREMAALPIPDHP